MVCRALTLLLPLLAEAAMVSLDSRQMAQPKANMPPTKKALKIENMSPKTSVAGAKRVKFTYGPYTLRAANSTEKVGNGKSMDKGGTAYQNLVDDDFPRDVTVLGGKSEVQTKEFRRAATSDGIYNHHNLFMDMSKPQKVVYGCAGREPKEPQPYSVFLAGATESGEFNYASTEPSIKAGYYLKKDRVMMNSIDVINYRNYDQEVYTVTEMEYIPGNVGYLDNVQAIVDPSICGGQNGGQIHPPKGVTKFSVESKDIVMNKNGYIMSMRGHVHDGGINLILKINGELVCDSRAVYGGEGHTTTVEGGRVWQTIHDTTECQKPVKVKKGDTIYMQANYDTELHPSRMMGGSPMSMGMGKGMGMKKRAPQEMDHDDEAEQMALMITYFAETDV